MKLAKPDYWENVRVMTTMQSFHQKESLDWEGESCFYAEGEIKAERLSIAQDIENLESKIRNENRNWGAISRRNVYLELQRIARVLRDGGEKP